MKENISIKSLRIKSFEKELSPCVVKALFLFSDVEGKAEDFVSFHLILFKYKTQLKNFTFTFGKKLIEETVSMVLAFYVGRLSLV